MLKGDNNMENGIAKSNRLIGLLMCLLQDCMSTSECKIQRTIIEMYWKSTEK